MPEQVISPSNRKPGEVVVEGGGKVRFRLVYVGEA